MGYWLAKSQTGRGLMTVAVKALIDEGFQQLELNRIQARVATDNHRSQAVCDRSGPKKEGGIAPSRRALRSLPRYDLEHRSEDRPVRPITRPRELDSGRFDWKSLG